MSQQRVPAKMLLNPIHCLSLGLGTGLAPKAPGTFGTLVGVLLYLPMQYLSWSIYLLVIIIGLLAGIYFCHYTAEKLGVHDHPAIVWDEVIGYLISMFMAPTGWLWLVLGFVYFRFFDIIKPWPIKWIDKKVDGGLGIMLDDVLAGIFAALVLQITVILIQ